VLRIAAATMEETTKNKDDVKVRDLNKMGRREEMKLCRKSEASLCSSFCNGKAISIIYSECVFVALVT
jgi:hypothetical protein